MSKAAAGKLQLHWKMLIGFLAGLALGLVAHYVAGSDAGWVTWLTTYITQPAGTLFLRLIFMLVIPLLFSALIIGVAEMGDIRSLGRVGWKAAIVGRARNLERRRATLVHRQQHVRRRTARIDPVRPRLGRHDRVVHVRRPGAQARRDRARCR